MPKKLASGKASAKKQKGKTKSNKSSKGKETQLEEDEADLSMASIGHPEIFPLVFTTKTQEIFNCRIDEDVTEENCFKLIKKEDIIQDMKTRAAISDFHPVKKVVLEYPGEELLVVFDANFQYGQSFYLVASEEAKENLLKPPETAEEEENKEGTLEVPPYKPPVSKPWVSLGSEKEVEEESVKDTVKKIKFMISRARRKFGAPITFTDKNASQEKDSYVYCPSYQDKTFSNKILEKDVGTQMVPKVREATTQTNWTYQKNAAMQYFPRELSNEEKEESLTSEKMKGFLTSVCLSMEIALQQNEIMNAFFDDWKALAEDESSSGGKPDISLKAYQSFTDLHYLKDRTISCVCWHPTIYGIIAVSVRQQLSYEEQANLPDKSLMQKSAILFWSFFDPIHPQLVLECPGDIYCFQFSPRDPNIIAGGCINGQINLCESDTNTERGPMRIIVRELLYHYKISEKKQALRKLEVPGKDSPYTEISTSSSKNLKVLENFSTNFFLGTEDGEIIYSDWKTEIHSDSATQVCQKYTISTKTINTLQRSPFFEDIILSVGDQNFAIWKEGVTNGPILKSSCSAGRNTVGHWSLTRPGVFFIGRDDGNIDIWDLLKKTHEPSHFQNISKSKITFISPWTASPKQHFLAISDDLGVLHVLEICQSLSDPPKNEDANLLEYFDREVKYLNHCEQELQEYQELQAKTELKQIWKNRGRKQV
ncbi:dynein axonemal intermediate chain 3 isoform X9 [Apus apus]|uniref:dynein axonemal intermediate chain 3 isoform X9 n=1 Tax=Apus apus TaxID=8895 RepID=UPI0021F8E734|nr:dynein axonemal intermediate chain 3 isoform X9 [Apus apus]